MIIFLYGEDTFRLKRKTKEILDRYKKEKSSLSFVSFNCLNSSLKELKEKNSQASLFEEKKLILIENLFKNKKLKEDFFQKIKEFISSKNIILISEEQKLNEKDILVSYLKKNVKFQKFNLLPPAKIKAWTEKEIKKHKAEISNQGLELLTESNDLWKINNEIKKLTSYSKKITEKEVLLLTNRKIKSDIFKTIEAISQKDKSLALKLIHNHLEKGDSPLYLLLMIGYQFKNLIILKELEEQKISFRQSGLPFFVTKKTTPLLPRFSLKNLKKIYQKIFLIDTNIKLGKVEPEAGLEILIAEI